MAIRVVLALIASHGYYGWCDPLEHAHTERERMQRDRGCSAPVPMGLGACRGAAAYPASSPDGVVSSRGRVVRAYTL